MVEVADDTISIRSLDWDRDRFDIEFGLQEGTTYNSFLIFGEKTCLVDASHEKFRDLYMKTLKDELEKRGRQLDYVVVSHTEPDHSGKHIKHSTSSASSQAPPTTIHPSFLLHTSVFDICHNLVVLALVSNYLPERLHMQV